MTHPQAHGRPGSTRVGLNVRRWRTARHRTAQLVADDWTDLLGRPVYKSTVINVELGRRRVDVDDLLALAVVLGVGPADLLAPADSEVTT
jgi:transcriptional regulator with XRE-family HTH domain